MTAPPRSGDEPVAAALPGRRLRGRAAIPRRRAAAWTLVAVMALLALYGLLDRLRDEFDVPVPTPTMAEFDRLREDVECAQAPGREGEERVEAMTQPALAGDVTSGELLDCPETWDGRQVRLVGEVVGGLLERGNRAWFQLNDDAYALELGPLPTHRDHRGLGGGVGVLAPLEELASLSFLGGPRSRGDIVEVVGMFHRVDPITREVAIVRADQVSVVSVGAQVRDQPVPLRRASALIALACAVAVVLVERSSRRRP